MVLKYLIPVKLSLGVMPSKSLLERYDLLEVCVQNCYTFLLVCHLGFVSILSLPSRVQYKDVIQALRTGDIRLLRQALQTHEDQYVSFTLWIFLSTIYHYLHFLISLQAILYVVVLDMTSEW